MKNKPFSLSQYTLINSLKLPNKRLEVTISRILHLPLSSCSKRTKLPHLCIFNPKSFCCLSTALFGFGLFFIYLLSFCRLVSTIITVFYIYYHPSLIHIQSISNFSFQIFARYFLRFHSLCNNVISYWL